MPHGGPADRDEWGFDWLPQYFASRGFAVLQPNFRGSSGYGDAWFEKNGFQSWEIAIAPVTDLGMLIEKSRGWSDFSLVSQYVGSGPHLHAGSPAEHANRISAPVLLFHGGIDRNVSIEESKHMAARLTAAGKTNKLVTWENLDHQLEDSSARAEMLRTSDEFLRNALGLSHAPAAGEQ